MKALACGVGHNSQLERFTVDCDWTAVVAIAVNWGDALALRCVGHRSQLGRVAQATGSLPSTQRPFSQANGDMRLLEFTRGCALRMDPPYLKELHSDMVEEALGVAMEVPI